MRLLPLQRSGSKPQFSLPKEILKWSRVGWSLLNYVYTLFIRTTFYHPFFKCLLESYFFSSNERTHSGIHIDAWVNSAINTNVIFYIAFTKKIFMKFKVLIFKICFLSLTFKSRKLINDKYRRSITMWGCQAGITRNIQNLKKSS